ncbi:MAG TPA: hypothetical protein VLM37_00635 [Fibrobacteraceae bacterium]|nr:hypothetical protein [Fibrobacteraceae bacterium]
MKNPIVLLIVVQNPDFEVRTRLEQMLIWSRAMVVVDNSLEAAPPMEAENLHWLWNGNRNGLAGGLNQGMEEAIRLNADWVLTLDQDSEFFSMESGMAFCAKAFSLPVETAWLSATHVFPFEMADFTEDPDCPPVTVEQSITSGTLLRVLAFQQCGPFREDFFIDSIDHEYCFRLQEHGWKVQIHPGIGLKHQLGNTRRHKDFQGLEHYASHHSPLRRYYMTRNRLWTIFHYRKSHQAFFRSELRDMAHELGKVLVYEDHKIQKLWMFLCGVLDFLRGHMGERSRLH